MQHFRARRGNIGQTNQRNCYLLSLNISSLNISYSFFGVQCVFFRYKIGMSVVFARFLARCLTRVLGQDFLVQKIKCTALLGRRNTVYSALLILTVEIANHNRRDY